MHSTITLRFIVITDFIRAYCISYCFYLHFISFAEVVRAMDFLVSEGLIMYWGTAKWSPIDVTEMYTACRQLNCSTPILEQSEYHMLCREKVEIYMPELYNKIG